MITPFFSLRQDDEFVYIEVKVSHVRFNAKTIEMTVNKEVFIFSLPPYYLRLRLPFSCVDDERSHSQFKDGVVHIRLPKETRGQHFPDLDLSAKLLARASEVLGVSGATGTPGAPARPLIEEMDVENNIEEGAAEGERHGWEIKQEAPVELIPSNKYGFDRQYSEIIAVSVSNGNDINELADPENTPEPQRIMERLIKENIKFDPEYYAMDYVMSKQPMEDEKDYQSLLEWKNPITSRFLKWYKHSLQVPEPERDKIMKVEFTQKEQEKMIDLPKKSYLVLQETKLELLLLIVSLLFAYHFDLRETEGDHNIESAWTIGKLVPQFSFLDSSIVVEGQLDNSLKACVITSMRRSLSYPLHRNYDLSKLVWEDVYYNLRGGKRLVLQSLLDLKELFRFHDVYYVYDHIWLQDLCTFLISDNILEMALRQLAHDVKKETDALDKSVVTFEKVDPEYQEPDSDDEEEGEEQDEMVTLSIQEIELMSQDT